VVALVDALKDAGYRVLARLKTKTARSFRHIPFAINPIFILT
jgi:hypothetical protein